MFETPFSKLTVVLSIFLSLIVVTFIFISDSNNSKTTLVFCDVGQGDGAYIRVKNQTDILVDAGPNRKILDCLGKYMPFSKKETSYILPFVKLTRATLSDVISKTKIIMW